MNTFIKTILLTGATGFLGSHLLEALLKSNYNIIILKRSKSNTWRIDKFLDKIIIYDLDVTPLENAFENHSIDCVIHTACSYGRYGQPAHEVVETNLLFGLRLLDAATLFKTSVFINTDTFFSKNTGMLKYLNNYSLSKKQFVEWLKQSDEKIKIINLRLEHVYGPNDDETKFVPWIVSQLKKNVDRIPLTIGTQLRDFIYIDDVVNAYLLILGRIKELKEFNDFDVGSGKLVSVKDFVTKLLDCYQQQNTKNRTILGFGDVPLREGEMMNVVVDASKLKKIGWKCEITLEQGIAKLCKM